jgi:hypothetical protein
MNLARNSMPEMRVREAVIDEQATTPRSDFDLQREMKSREGYLPEE